MEQLPEQTPDTSPEPQERSMADALKREIARERGEDLQTGDIPDELPSEAAAAADETAAEETTPEAEAKAQPRTAEVEVDGKTYVVPSELKDGYLRQADYTKKTQAVAGEREAVAQMRAVVEQTYAVAQNLGPLLAQFHQAQQKGEQYGKVDWDSLYRDDPILHNKLRLEAQENWLNHQNLAGKLQEAPRLLSQINEAAFKAEVARNAPQALEWVPDLSKRKDEFFQTGREYGFNDQELNYISDARLVRALRDLSEYRKLTKDRDQIRQKVQSAPSVATPGARAQTPQVTGKEYKAAVSALKTDSSDEAFINALRTQRRLQGRS